MYCVEHADHATDREPNKSSSITCPRTALQRQITKDSVAKFHRTLTQLKGFQAPCGTDALAAHSKSTLQTAQQPCPLYHLKEGVTCVGAPSPFKCFENAAEYAASLGASSHPCLTLSSSKCTPPAMNTEPIPVLSAPRISCGSESPTATIASAWTVLSSPPDGALFACNGGV